MGSTDFSPTTLLLGISALVVLALGFTWSFRVFPAASNRPESHRRRNTIFSFGWLSGGLTLLWLALLSAFDARSLIKWAPLIFGLNLVFLVFVVILSDAQRLLVELVYGDIDEPLDSKRRFVASLRASTKVKLAFFASCLAIAFGILFFFTMASGISGNSALRGGVSLLVGIGTFTVGYSAALNYLYRRHKRGRGGRK